MATDIPSAADLIDKWPSLSDFAKDAGVEYGTAKAMRRRSSIAPKHWPKIIAGAQRREITAVTYETLSLAHADQEIGGDDEDQGAEDAAAEPTS